MGNLGDYVVEQTYKVEAHTCTCAICCIKRDDLGFFINIGFIAWVHG